MFVIFQFSIFDYQMVHFLLNVSILPAWIMSNQISCQTSTILNPTFTCYIDWKQTSHDFRCCCLTVFFVSGFMGRNPKPSVTTCDAEPAWMWFMMCLRINRDVDGPWFSSDKFFTEINNIGLCRANTSEFVMFEIVGHVVAAQQMQENRSVETSISWLGSQVVEVNQ